MSIKCGVPQGSTLGPLLFLLYINDLNSLFNTAIAIHFADDTHLSYASKKLSTTESEINCELKKLAEWLLDQQTFSEFWKIWTSQFSPRSKTKKELEEITIKVNKSKLSPVPNINYLGVVFDEFLSCNAHVNYLCKKLSQTNGILSKLRHYVTQKTCISVCGSLAWQLVEQNI